MFPSFYSTLRATVPSQLFSFIPFYLTGFLGNNSRGVVEQWVNYKIKGQAYGEQSMGSLLLAALCSLG